MSCPGMSMPFMSRGEFCCAKQTVAAKQNRVNRVFINNSPMLHMVVAITLPQRRSCAQRRIQTRGYAGNFGRFASGYREELKACQTPRQTPTSPSRRGFYRLLRSRTECSRGRRCRYNRCPPAPDRGGSGGAIQYAARVRGGRLNTAPWRTSICTREQTEVLYGWQRSVAVRRAQFAEFLLRSFV